MRALLITYVWPEPQSSAAGIRTLDLIAALQSMGGVVEVGSPSAFNAHSETLQRRQIPIHSLRPNSQDLPALIDQVKSRGRFDVVVFDRFVTEEMFGWVFASKSPDTTRIVDTQDLHFLRRYRQAACESGRDFREFIAEIPPSTDSSLLRELGAIIRSDLSFVLSDHEAHLLTRRFGVDSRKIMLSRIGTLGHPVGPSDRKGFSWIGNHRHPPNADSLFWLATELWPAIRAKLPHGEIDVYGAYPSRVTGQFHDPGRGLIIHGPAESAIESIARSRVLLAPIRFGAGIKGKIIDAWASGTPVCATSMASEGMMNQTPAEWGGLIGDDVEAFTTAAILLHEDPRIWQTCFQNALRLVEGAFSRENAFLSIQAGIRQANENKATWTRGVQDELNRFLGFRANEYFSKWIAEKEKSAHNRGVF